MNDQAVLDGLLLQGNTKTMQVFVLKLKELWRQREMAYIQTWGKSAYCDCVFYQPGDYATALAQAEAALAGN